MLQHYSHFFSTLQEICLHSSQNVVNNKKLLLRAGFLRYNWIDACMQISSCKSSIAIFKFCPNIYLVAIPPKIIPTKLSAYTIYLLYTLYTCTSCAACRAHGKVSIGPNGKARSRWWQPTSEANCFCHCDVKNLQVSNWSTQIASVTAILWFFIRFSRLVF